MNVDFNGSKSKFIAENKREIIILFLMKLFRVVDRWTVTINLDSLNKLESEAGDD